jgi:DNA helicase HerA-like ATPase
MQTIDQVYRSSDAESDLPEEALCLGLVGSPQGQEATSRQFFFWVARDVLVEETQLVYCDSVIAGRTYRFYGIVEEVVRRSRKRSMDDEIDQADGDIDYVPPFESDGYTYARVSILAVTPRALTPPRERSKVYLAGKQEAAIAYAANEIRSGRALPIGLIKNGGEPLAGAGLLDLDYLLGLNGGHLNVTGSTGRGTKSSFLLFVVWMLLHYCRELERSAPSQPDRTRIVPVIFNVKNYDLFFIDRQSKYFAPEHQADWLRLGVSDPHPFRNVTFYAPASKESGLPVYTRRSEGVTPYSWGLQDIIERGLFRYLFAEEDASDPNFSALVLDVEASLTREIRREDGSLVRTLNSSGPQTFQELLEWVNRQSNKRASGDSEESSQGKEGTQLSQNHHLQTWKKLYRRLFLLVSEGSGVLRRHERQGRPLDVVRADTSDPLVIDLFSLAGMPEMQRFVVATIFRQLVEARSGSRAVSGLVYVVMLDELNRFAPRGARDPITQLIETVAAEMRSQGIILLGAQQQASRVSEKVIENAAIKVLGRTGSLELGTPVWRFLSESARERALNLRINEKLIIQDAFREPMLVRVPFPVWAMNPEEAVSPLTAASDGQAGYSDQDDLIEH